MQAGLSLCLSHIHVPHCWKSCVAAQIILNLDQWFRRYGNRLLFSILSSGSHFVQRSGVVCRILVVRIRRNICEKLF